MYVCTMHNSVRFDNEEACVNILSCDCPVMQVVTELHPFVTYLMVMECALRQRPLKLC